MIVLGLTDAAPCGAAVVIDGVVAAVADEAALAGIPAARGMPRRALTLVLDRAGVTAGDIDLVLVDGIERRSAYRLRSLEAVPAVARPLSPARRVVLRPVFAWRRHLIGRVLDEEFAVTAPVEFVNHHRGRAAGAYFTSGYVDALVVTTAPGDGDQGHVYDVRNGHFRRIGVAAADDFAAGGRSPDASLLAGFVQRHLHGNKPRNLVLAGDPFCDDAARDRLVRLVGIDEVYGPPDGLVASPALGAAFTACCLDRKERRMDFDRGAAGRVRDAVPS